ncbi:MAG: DUF302 domain-containing protein [Betaproteobacteria bacterium]|nr:DUF302 domain-containing protein [Betaproteobacteria bacterium]
MKNFWLGALGILFAINASAAVNGLAVKESKYGVNQTVERLEKALQAKGMTIFAHIDHRAEAEKVGMKMRPTQLIIFGNPKGGTLLMDAAPTVAIDLPMKAIVWQGPKGHVWLAYNTMAYLKTRHHIKGMGKLIGKLDGMLNAVTNQVVN